MNGDSCIISLSRFGSGKCFAIEFSKQNVLVAEEVFLSILSRLPWDERSFSSRKPRRWSKSKISKMWKFKLTLILSIVSDTALATPDIQGCVPRDNSLSMLDGLSVILTKRVYAKCHCKTLTSMNLHDGVKVGFFGNSPYRTRNDHRGWTKPNCFAKVSQSIWLFLIHGLLEICFIERIRRRRYLA